MWYFLGSPFLVRFSTYIQKRRPPERSGGLQIYGTIKGLFLFTPIEFSHTLVA